MSIEIDIHPDIKKFWKDSGYEISYIEFAFGMKRWLRHKSPVFVNHKIIAHHILNINGALEIQYILDPSAHKTYSEREMLKIIKLISFA